MKYILRISSPDFGKPQNFMISFFHSLCLNKMIFIFSRDWNFSFPRKEKSSLFKKNLFFYLTN